MRIGCATFLRFTNSQLSHPTFKQPLVVRGFCNLPFRGRKVSPAGRHSKTACVSALPECGCLSAPLSRRTYFHFFPKSDLLSIVGHQCCSMYSMISSVPFSCVTIGFIFGLYIASVRSRTR